MQVRLWEVPKPDSFKARVYLEMTKQMGKCWRSCVPTVNCSRPWWDCWSTSVTDCLLFCFCNLWQIFLHIYKCSYISLLVYNVCLVIIVHSFFSLEKKANLSRMTPCESWLLVQSIWCATQLEHYWHDGKGDLLCSLPAPCFYSCLTHA